MKNLIVKKRFPHFADDDFSRAFSGVEMFSNDECRARHFDCIVVDDAGRSVLRPFMVVDASDVSSLKILQ